MQASQSGTRARSTVDVPLLSPLSCDDNVYSTVRCWTCGTPRGQLLEPYLMARRMGRVDKFMTAFGIRKLCCRTYFLALAENDCIQVVQKHRDGAGLDSAGTRTLTTDMIL